MTTCLLLTTLALTPAAEYPRPELLIEATGLAKKLESMRVLDTRDKTAYLAGHIPGAVWVDALAWGRAFNAEPDAAAWGKRLGLLGVDPAKPTAIVYGSVDNVREAARVWWVLRYWGCKDVALVNGGQAAWKAAGGKLDTTDVKPNGPPVAVRAVPEKLFTKDQLLAALKGKPPLIVDGRSYAEHCGDQETAKRNGMVPGSIHLEWKVALDEKTARFKTPDELSALLRERKIDVDQPAVTYCQSGGRAAVVAFALELMGGKQVANYYKSWSEWGNAVETPIVKPEKK
ncbi:MAG: rhodanese-like domain-containing protein [Gemmataceae bacterium]